MIRNHNNSFDNHVHILHYWNSIIHFNEIYTGHAISFNFTGIVRFVRNWCISTRLSFSPSFFDNTYCRFLFTLNLSLKKNDGIFNIFPLLILWNNCKRKHISCMYIMYRKLIRIYYTNHSLLVIGRFFEA